MIKDKNKISQLYSYYERSQSLENIYNSLLNERINIVIEDLLYLQSLMKIPEMKKIILNKHKIEIEKLKFLGVEFPF